MGVWLLCLCFLFAALTGLGLGLFVALEWYGDEWVFRKKYFHIYLNVYIFFWWFTVMKG